MTDYATFLDTTDILADEDVLLVSILGGAKPGDTIAVYAYGGDVCQCPFVVEITSVEPTGMVRHPYRVGFKSDRAAELRRALTYEVVR